MKIVYAFVASVPFVVAGCHSARVSLTPKTESAAQAASISANAGGTDAPLPPEPSAAPARAAGDKLLRLPEVTSASYEASSRNPARFASHQGDARLQHSSTVQPASAAEERDPNDAPAPMQRGAAKANELEAIGPGTIQRGLTLAEAIELTLTDNPDLASARTAEDVSRAKLGVARTYPFNPVLNYDIRPATREISGESGSTLNMVSVTQEVELAHQRRYRNWGGEADLSNAIWTIRQAEITAIAQTERLYFTAVYQRQLRDFARQSAQLSGQMADILQRRFDAGQATTSDLALARIELAALRRQAALAEAAYATSVADLRRQIGRSSGVQVEPNGALTDWRWRPLDDGSSGGSSGNSSAGQPHEEGSYQVTALASERPDVQAARAAAASAAAQLALARANRIPNLTIGPVYERDEAGTTFYGVEGSLPIPIRDTGRALVEQRAAETRAAQIAAEQLLRKGELEIQDALDHYHRALASIAALRQGTMEDLARQVDQVEQQFKAGQTDLLRVFAARASLLQARRAELDALNELTQAAAAVTLVTGLPPEALLAPNQTPSSP